MSRTLRLARLMLLGAAGGLLFTAPVFAQPPVRVGVEAAFDRATYHFDSPSNYDTSGPVPHFFEQHYVLDNVWLIASGGYRAGLDWQTRAGFTTTRQARATDYDTFFDADNVTWVSGTTGDAKMHSMRLAQEVDLGRAGPVTLAGGYRLRLDFADFLAGDKTDARNGVTVLRQTVTTHEYTTAQTHDLFIAATREHPLSARLQLRMRGEIVPAAVNRLAIRLPEKYPGQTLVFRTATVAAYGSVTLEKADGWPLSLTLAAGRRWSYRAGQRADHPTLALEVMSGRGW